tara:strand:+ start:302 stop:772 length:471 start_codon:yes stop_codon:yes gene_type:complete
MTTMAYYDKNVETNGTYVPVERYVDEYCKALSENYKQETMRSYERYISTGDSAEYYGERLLEILQGKANLRRYRYTEGKKYFKVVAEEFDTFQDRNVWKDTTVHAFVDKVTGEVYKPAGWAKPAKHVRYDLRKDLDRLKLHDPNRIDWAGGYLYLR